MENKIHDAVCDCSGVCDPPNTSCEIVTYSCGCECSGIAKGRSDEREKAAREIEAYGSATHEPHDKSYGCLRCDIHAAYKYAAKIVRGES